jgi:hypothetical protein
MPVQSAQDPRESAISLWGIASSGRTVLTLAQIRSARYADRAWPGRCPPFPSLAAELWTFVIEGGRGAGRLPLHRRLFSNGGWPVPKAIPLACKGWDAMHPQRKAA